MGLKSEMSLLRADTDQLGDNLSQSNKERFKQIKELMEALRFALERNDRLELTYKGKITKIEVSNIWPIF